MVKGPERQPGPYEMGEEIPKVPDGVLDEEPRSDLPPESRMEALERLTQSQKAVAALGFGLLRTLWERSRGNILGALIGNEPLSDAERGAIRKEGWRRVGRHVAEAYGLISQIEDAVVEEDPQKLVEIFSGQEPQKEATA